jgi:hypothetical protein
MKPIKQAKKSTWNNLGKQSISIRFYLKMVVMGQGGSQMVYVFYNHYKGIEGSCPSRIADRESAKRYVHRWVKKNVPGFDKEIEFWR